MAGLACGEVSVLAWDILHNGADDFMTLSEDAIPQAMQILAKDENHIEAGESAVPGFAAAVLARQDSDYATALGLGSESKVLVIGTEGATDPELYRELVK